MTAKAAFWAADGSARSYLGSGLEKGLRGRTAKKRERRGAEKGIGSDKVKNRLIQRPRPSWQDRLPAMALDIDRVDLVVCGTGLPESLVAR